MSGFQDTAYQKLFAIQQLHHLVFKTIFLKSNTFATLMASALSVYHLFFICLK